MVAAVVEGVNVIADAGADIGKRHLRLALGAGEILRGGHLHVARFALEYRDAMRARIAEIAGLSIDRVGVKATTNEKLGAIGNGEGIAAYATATIRLPWSAP